MVKISGEAKHDRICDLVICELKSRGFIVIDHFEYSNIKSGELDIFAFKPNYKRGVLVEVKYTNGHQQHKHADEQTKRAVEYCPLLQEFENITRMYAYHDGNTYQLHKL